MKEMLRYGFVLAIICAAASASLAVVNKLTYPKIIAQAQAEEDAGLKEVLPQAAGFLAVKDKEGVVYYKAMDKDGRFIGAAFKASGKGYSSTVETLAGMSKDGVISAIKVLSQNETPGLGSQVAGQEFSRQFSGRQSRDLENVQVISGATISSRAVIEAVRKKAEAVRALIANEK